MVETADREKAETEYARQIEELEIRRDEELGSLREKLITEEEQVILVLTNNVRLPLIRQRDAEKHLNYSTTLENVRSRCRIYLDILRERRDIKRDAVKYIT